MALSAIKYLRGEASSAQPAAAGVVLPDCAAMGTARSVTPRLDRALVKRLQGAGDRFVDQIQPDELHTGAYLFRNLLEVLAVAGRQHHPGNAGASRGNNLLLDAAHRQNKSPETDFAGHGGVAAHRPVGHQRDQRHEHGDAGTWTVLGNSAGRHMHVDVRLLKARHVNAKIGGTILDDAERRLRALAHDFAELAGQDQPPATGRARGLDEQDVAADRSPGEAGGDAGNAGTHREYAFELGGPEHGRQIVNDDANRPAFAFGDAHGGVAQGLADLTLETAHASFARVTLNDLAQRPITNLGLLRCQAVRLELATHKISARNLQLFVGRVARQPDDLHPVAQGSRDRVQEVGSRNENDATEVERHRQVVVAERAVLLRIQHLQERCAGIALDAGSELVDLVEHHHAVAGARLADGLNDVAG